MVMTREEKLDRLQKLERLQVLQAQKEAEDSGTTLVGLAQSFNKGLVDFGNLPYHAINLFSTLVGKGFAPGVEMPQIPVDKINESLAAQGFIAKPGEEQEGMLNRGAEILGASVAPAGGFQVLGKEVLKRGIPAAQRTVTQQLAATTAKNPAATAALDVSSSFGAGFGGEVASNMSDDPSMIVLGELAGGFTIPGVTAVARVAGKPVINKAKEVFTPFTKAGAEPRAARRLQSLSADPEGEARLIDVDSPVSPARQTGNPRLIALERTVLEQNPEMEARFTKELNGALDAARTRAAEFGGTDRTRAILEGGQEHLIELVNLRAAQAAQTAQARIAKLGGNVSQRDTSRIAREELNLALKDVRAEETRLWNAIDKKAPGTFDNTKLALGELKDETGSLVPSKIPPWIAKVAGTEQPVTLNDIKQVRSRVLSDAREAANKGKFDKSRQMNKIADGLLADMGAVNDPNTKAALAYSRELNKKFSEGTVGAILNRGANRGAGIADADTLNQVFSGKTPATNAAQFLKASPDSRPQLEQFLKTGFVKAAGKGFNQTKAQAHIDKLESQGMFEVFPELKAQMESVRNLAKKSAELAERAATVTDRGGSRLLRDNNKSLAGALLDAEPGQEMATLLGSENPEALAGVLARRMGGNQNALNGLKTSFVEALFNKASKTGGTGEIEVSGKKLASLLNDNLGVAKALGMNDADITRMRAITKQLIQAQQSTGDSVGAILDDKPAAFLDFIARWAGAKFGQRVAGGGMGASIVIAGEGSKQSRNILQKLTTNEAQKMLIAAQADPVLYKALLTKMDGKHDDIFAATRVIESWLIGAGVEAGNN